MILSFSKNKLQDNSFGTATIFKRHTRYIRLSELKSSGKISLFALIPTQSKTVSAMIY